MKLIANIWNFLKLGIRLRAVFGIINYERQDDKLNFYIYKNDSNAYCTY